MAEQTKYTLSPTGAKSAPTEDPGNEALPWRPHCAAQGEKTPPQKSSEWGDDVTEMRIKVCVFFEDYCVNIIHSSGRVWFSLLMPFRGCALPLCRQRREGCCLPQWHRSLWAVCRAVGVRAVPLNHRGAATQQGVRVKWEYRAQSGWSADFF